MIEDPKVTYGPTVDTVLVSYVRPYPIPGGAFLRRRFGIGQLVSRPYPVERVRRSGTGYIIEIGDDE